MSSTTSPCFVKFLHLYHTFSSLLQLRLLLWPMHFLGFPLPLIYHLSSRPSHHYLFFRPNHRNHFFLIFPGPKKYVYINFLILSNLITVTVVVVVSTLSSSNFRNTRVFIFPFLLFNTQHCFNFVVAQHCRRFLPLRPDTSNSTNSHPSRFLNFPWIFPLYSINEPTSKPFEIK